MKKLLISLFTVMGISTIAQADTLYGLYADANYWYTNNDIQVGTIKQDATKKGQYMVSASFEHFVPFIPNARVRHTSLNNTGMGALQNHETTLNNTDVVAYYEFLDNIVSLDLGVGAKVLNGNHKINGNGVSLNKTLPMVYGSVGGTLPFTALSAKAEVGIAKGLNTSVNDALVEVKYDFLENFLVDVGAKAGYRVLSLEQKNASTYKMDFKGPYVGLELHF